MRMLLKLGWRNIWRNRRRTLINMSAVGIGLLLVIVYSGLLAGMMGEATSQMDNSGAGHVEITAPGWRTRHNVTAYLAGVPALRLPEGAETGARVVARGLLTSARGGQGVTLHGVDVEAEASLSAYVNDVRQGEKLAAGDENGILVGDQLAEKLRVGVGHKVRLMVQRADGEMGAGIFRVRGIFHSIAPAIARGTAVVTAGAARALLGMESGVHQVVIQLPRAAEADGVAAELRAALGPAHEVATYGELMPILKTMESLMDTLMLFITLFVYFLVGLGILNTMLMSVLERTREFGVIQAIGEKPPRVVGIVLAEAFWIATVSVAGGLALGLLITWIGTERPIFDFSRSIGEAMDLGGAVLRSKFKTELSLASALRASALVYVLTLLVGLYPAWKVSRMRPADALRAA